MISSRYRIKLTGPATENVLFFPSEACLRCPRSCTTALHRQAAENVGPSCCVYHRSSVAPVKTKRQVTISKKTHAPLPSRLSAQPCLCRRSASPFPTKPLRLTGIIHESTSPQILDSARQSRSARSGRHRHRPRLRLRHMQLPPCPRPCRARSLLLACRVEG